MSTLQDDIFEYAHLEVPWRWPRSGKDQDVLEFLIKDSFHSQSKPSCTPCDKKFETEKQLEKHKQTVHGPEAVEGEAVEVVFILS